MPITSCEPAPPTPAVGHYLVPDGWSIGQQLQASDWERAPFRLPLVSRGPISSIAVRIEITGRVRQFRGTCAWWRCRIVVVGDGEPDTTMGGWMRDP
jgi:hypothetical protein